ncbi:MAG: hypothetical protein PF961_02655 [Planctomycetota bacterium]|nr:hypothetical protein [Planctomycetota bacterium]
MMRNWVVALGALAVVSLGSFWLWTRAAGGTTPVHVTPASERLRTEDGFVSYGRFEARGRVLRDMGIDEERGSRTLLIIADPQQQPLNTYQVFQDRGMYMVSTSYERIPFAKLEVFNPSALPAVQPGDVLSVSGSYGEYSKGTLTTSVPGLDIFVVRIDE